MAGTVDVQVAGAHLRRIREGFALTSEYRSIVSDGRTNGLTIEDVVTLSKGELSRSVISKLERGEIKNPSLDLLMEVAKIYQMTPNDMAELYGYWQPIVQQAAADRRVKRFLQQVDWFRSRGSFKAEVLLNALEADLKMVDELPD
jgi:transcriptional regulator with XRE-family HTH domain